MRPITYAQTVRRTTVPLLAPILVPEIIRIDVRTEVHRIRVMGETRTIVREVLPIFVDQVLRTIAPERVFRINVVREQQIHVLERERPTNAPHQNIIHVQGKTQTDVTMVLHSLALLLQLIAVSHTTKAAIPVLPQEEPQTNQTGHYDSYLSILIYNH
jgi:hypothetical protein